MNVTLVPAQIDVEGDAVTVIPAAPATGAEVVSEARIELVVSPFSELETEEGFMLPAAADALVG